MLETIQQLKRYFSIAELVGKDCATKYGEFAWAFFDIRLLEVLLWLREGLNIPLVCCTPQLQQRGLRTNVSPLVRTKTLQNMMYCSAHCLGKGIDLSSGRMTAMDMRQWIRKHIDDCPHPIRIENDESAPTWLHIDIMNLTDKKLIEFKA